MTSRNFFLFQAFVALAYGIPLLLMPEAFMNLSAVSKVEMTTKFDLIARGYATVLIGVGIASIVARNAGPSIARRGFFALALVTNTLVIIVGIGALLRGEEKSSGWITIVMTAILLAWSGMLWSKDKDLKLE